MYRQALIMVLITTSPTLFYIILFLDLYFLFIYFLLDMSFCLISKESPLLNRLLYLLALFISAFTFSYFILSFIVFGLLELHLCVILYFSGCVVDWILEYMLRDSTSLSMLREIPKHFCPNLFVRNSSYHACILVQ